MIKFKKYLEEVNEGKIVLKRKYTENYPEKNVRKGTTVRNAIIEALRDKKLTLSEFKEIVSRHSKSPNKWTQRNKRFFTIEEDNVSLSKYGTKILDSLEPVNEKTHNKKSVLKALGKSDDATILVKGQEYIIYNPDSNNDDNAAMWGDKTVFALDQDGDEHEIDYKDIERIDAYESVVTEKKVHPGKYSGLYYDTAEKVFKREGVPVGWALIDKWLQKAHDQGHLEYTAAYGKDAEKDIKAAIKSITKDVSNLSDYKKTLKMFAYESKVNEARIKPFRKVKAGDVGQDYNGEDVTIVAVGKLGKLMRYDDTGMAEDGLSQGYLDKRDDAVAVESPDGGYAVYTYGDDGVMVAESEINEGRAKATQMLKDVAKGSATEVEGIKLSKEMAGCFLEWLKSSTYGKKFSDLPFNKLFTASFNWGLDRYISKDCKPEYKELKQQAKAMKEMVYTSFSNFINEKYDELNEKTLEDYGLSRKFGSALDALPSKKFNDKDVTALAKKYKENVGQALKYAKSAFGWLWNESNELIAGNFEDFINEEIVNEALKSSKLRNLLSMHKTHKSILKAIYGKTKIALDKVEDHQLQDIDPKDGQNVKGIVFYYTTQEKDNPYADPDSYWNQKFPANALLAVGTGKEFYYVSYDYRNGRGEGYSLSTSATRSFRRSNADVGYNKNYRGWDASGLGSVKRVQAVADAAFVIDPANFGTTIDKRELRAKSREGAIAFQDDREFRRANELRYKEILTKRASKEPIDKMVEKAIDDIADLMKAAMKNQTKNQYGEIVAGTGANGRAYRINDLTHFASKIMDDYERWASYINQAAEAEKSLKDEGGDSSYSQYSIKRYKTDAAEYAKSIKDRLKKLKKRNLAW